MLLNSKIVKKMCILKFVFVLVCVVLFVNCSSDSEQLTVKSEKIASSELVSNFTQDEFKKSLDEVSNFVLQNTRANIDETKAKEVMMPFVEDGKNIQKQLLDDKKLTDIQRDSLENLSDNELAILSVMAYSIIDTTNDAVGTRSSYPVNRRLTCVGQALAGGSSFTGIFTWTFIKRVGQRTALRVALGAFGGMVGGAITAAMFINDYNICMNGKF